MVVAAGTKLIFFGAVYEFFNPVTVTVPVVPVPVIPVVPVGHFISFVPAQSHETNFFGPVNASAAVSVNVVNVPHHCITTR